MLATNPREKLSILFEKISVKRRWDELIMWSLSMRKPCNALKQSDRIHCSRLLCSSGKLACSTISAWDEGIRLRGDRQRYRRPEFCIESGEARVGSCYNETEG